MDELRSTEQRKSDVLAALGLNSELWLATASASGRPHLIAVSSWWDGEQIVIATPAGNRTARNLDATGVGRLAVGTSDDAAMIDVRVSAKVAVEEASPGVADGFAAATGWNPAEVGSGWKFFRLQPLRIQAYRGYDEIEGRDVMADSAWLA